MKKLKVFRDISIILSILALALTLELTRLSSVSSSLRWAWIVFLLVPLEILVLLYGLYLKRKAFAYKGVLAAALICLPLLLLLCSAQFVNHEYDYYYSRNLLQSIEAQTSFAFPEDFEADINVQEDYVECFIRMLDASEKRAMDEAIEDSELWTNSFDTRIINALPIYIVPGLQNYHYCMVYNESTGECNQYPEQPGEYKFLFLTYDAYRGRFMILRADAVCE